MTALDQDALLAAMRKAIDPFELGIDPSTVNPSADQDDCYNEAIDACIQTVTAIMGPHRHTSSDANFGKFIDLLKAQMTALKR